MNKIAEIKEALDAVDYPEHEFRGYCSELIGLLEVAEKALEEVSEQMSIVRCIKIADDALQQLRS